MARRGRNCLLTLLLSSIALPVLAQPSPTPTPSHTTGMLVLKTCPATAAPGSTFMCTFAVQNQDEEHGVNNLSVTNTVPYPGGPTTAVVCRNTKGVAVTSL